MVSFIQILVNSGRTLVLAAWFIASANNLVIAAEKQDACTAKPKVIEFYANWCRSEQKELRTISSLYGSEIEFVHYDVDDPAAQDAVKRYEVCPIPMVLFIDEKNRVVDYAIGATPERILEKKLDAILNQRQKLYKSIVKPVPGSEK